MDFIKKPKIAILTLRNSYNYGGVLSSLKVTYEFCQQYFDPTVFFLGFDADVATSIRTGKFTSSTKPLSYFGMNCVEIGARWAFWEPGHYAFTLPAWKKALEDFDYFFVVSGTCIAAHPLVQLGKKFPLWIGTPYNEDRTERVKQLKGIRYAIDRLAQHRMNVIEKEILQKSDFIWAISSYAQQRFGQISGRSDARLTHCGYPIDCSQMTPVHKGKEKILVVVGRFSDPRKNFDMLMRVFDTLHYRMPQIKLYVVGMKPTNQQLAPYRKKKSFNRIVFTGQVSSNDLKMILASASLMLITSHQEGLGIVGLEALLHGTPVIATDCGGTKDYVINDITGYLVGVNDDQAMVDKALFLLSNPDRHAHMSLNGQRFVKEHFSIDTIYQSFKYGLGKTYPELEEWFMRCDQQGQGEIIKDKQPTQLTA